MRKILLLTILISLPLLAIAAGLVPCGGPAGPPCKLCHFFVLGQKIINFLTIDIMPIAVAAAVAIGAVWMLISGGNETYRARGKGIITTAIWGAIIVAVSWLIINEVLINFTKPGVYTPWTIITC